jgi:hemerythrin-like domain-containing protein
MGKYDMTLMFAMHNALRRDLERIAKITASVDDDPRQILADAVGWGLFKNALHVHHTAEDEALWPPLRQALASRPDDLAVVEAMETEHAAIDPLIESIDAALADRDSGPARLADLTDALTITITGHLRHEEDEALPLVDDALSIELVQNFGQVHRAKSGPDGSRLTPWLLDGADEKTIATMMALLPEPVRAAYRDQWQPAYAALEKWNRTT